MISAHWHLLEGPPCYMLPYALFSSWTIFTFIVGAQCDSFFQALMQTIVTVTAGVWYDDPQSVELAKQIASKTCVAFKGLYIHEGDTYSCKSDDKIKDSTEEIWKKLRIILNR